MKIFSKGNKKLPKSTLIWNLPAEITCPKSTEQCRKFCYAKKAERIYPQVLPFRINNLRLSKLKDFTEIIKQSLYKEKDWDTIRIHESGDFYTQEYLNKWIEITKFFPYKMFYAYTRSTHLDFNERSNNFIIIVSDDNEITREKYYEYYNRFNGIASVETNNKYFFVCPMNCNKCCYCFVNYNYFKHINFKKH